MCICNGLMGTADRTQATGPGATFPCVGHQEHNENAVGCDGRWQVGRNGDRLNTESIKRKDWCSSKPDSGSIQWLSCTQATSRLVKRVLCDIILLKKPVYLVLHHTEKRHLCINLFTIYHLFRFYTKISHIYTGRKACVAMETDVSKVRCGIFPEIVVSMETVTQAEHCFLEII